GGVCADAHERGVAEGELAGDAVNQIETRREDDVDADLHEDEVVIVIEIGLHQAIEGIEGKDQRGEGDVDHPRREFVGVEIGHTFSIAVEPKRPEGLTRRTRMRMTKETASA